MGADSVRDARLARSDASQTSIRLSWEQVLRSWYESCLRSGQGKNCRVPVYSSMPGRKCLEGSKEHTVSGTFGVQRPDRARSCSLLLAGGRGFSAACGAVARRVSRTPPHRATLRAASKTRDPPTPSQPTPRAPAAASRQTAPFPRRHPYPPHLHMTWHRHRLPSRESRVAVTAAPNHLT